MDKEFHGTVTRLVLWLLFILILKKRGGGEKHPVIFFGCRAGETFCQMACGMLFSIGDFLRMGIDEIVKNMYELSDNDEDEDMATR